MATIIKKKKKNQLYYYLVESARIDGKRMTGLMFPDLQFRDLFQKGGANDTSSMTGLMPFYILAFLQMPASHGTEKEEEAVSQILSLIKDYEPNVLTQILAEDAKDGCLGWYLEDNIIRQAGGNQS